MKSKLLIVVVTTFLALSVVPGASVKVVNLVEMETLADRIFLGQCLSVEKGVNARALPYYEYRFRVSRGLKGVTDGQTVVFRQLAPSSSTPALPLPRYRAGESALVFLHPDSSLGLTSPVGLVQGVFQTMDQDGRMKVVNGVDNRNLVTGLSVNERKHLGLDGFQLEAGIPLEQLRIALDRSPTLSRGKVSVQ